MGQPCSSGGANTTRVYDAVIGTRFCKMITTAGPGAMLFVNNCPEDLAGLIEHRKIGLGMLKYHNTGTHVQCIDPFCATLSTNCDFQPQNYSTAVQEDFTPGVRRTGTAGPLRFSIQR